MSLALRDVGFTYGRGTSFATRALTGVDLSVERGELVLVLGTTGSGKSTLARVAAGLLQPDQGAVTLDGKTVAGPLAAVRPGVGIVFQMPELQLFAESIEADVAFGPRNQGLSQADAHAAAHTALTSVGLDPKTFGPRSPFSLSGGEARRVAIAGVLAMAPGYLLLDEPTAGLDPAGKEAVRQIVSDARGDAGVVVVTHEAEEFLETADRVVILSEGSVSFEGTVDGLVQNPDVIAASGLRAPEVLQAQIIASERGLILERFALDPVQAASLLAAAWSAKR